MLWQVLEERGLVTDRMILPRFRAIWRRWRRGAALFGPYKAKLEHSQALRQQRRLAMERERREASIAIAAVLNSRTAFRRARAALQLPLSNGSIVCSADLVESSPGPGIGNIHTDSPGGAPKSIAAMRAGKHRVHTDETNKNVLQSRSGTALGLTKISSQDCVSSNMQRMRAELCWPVAPPPLPPPPQEPYFTPSNLAFDGGRGEHLTNRGDNGDRRRGPNRYSRGREGVDGCQQRGGKERMPAMAEPTQSSKSSSAGAAIQSLSRGPDTKKAALATGRQRAADAGMDGLCPIDAFQVAGPVKVEGVSGMSRNAQHGIAKTTVPLASIRNDSDWQARGAHIPSVKVPDRQGKQRRDRRGGQLPSRAGEQRVMRGGRRDEMASGWASPASGRALDKPDSQLNIPHAPTSSSPVYMPPARPLLTPSELCPPAPGKGCRLQVEPSSPAASVPVVWSVQQEMDLPFFF